MTQAGSYQRWGPHDQLGAANELTPEVTVAATKLVRSGRTYDLSQPISTAIPRLAGQPPYSMCIWTNPAISRRSFERDQHATNGIGFIDERVEFDLHAGTHIDALGHTSVANRMYNGVLIEDAVTNSGLARLGIENVPPIATRGLLVDAVAFRGRDLVGGEVITKEDIHAALNIADLHIEPGDVVLIRTGWSRYYGVDNSRYVDSAPGIDVTCARWLAHQRVVAVGSDTMSLEVAPGVSDHEPYPVHQFLLAEAGVYIIEQANLEELAADKVLEFFCLVLAPKFSGGTGSPVRLTAIA
jgi:kynurenine formamidase